MNKHLWEQVASLFKQYRQATLSTCSHADPQVSIVPYQFNAKQLILLVPHTSDHLFHLEHHPNIVLLTPTWKLHGQGHVLQDEDVFTPPHPWQIAILVHPIRIHILTEDGIGYAETIDLE